ncbi:MAG TPA: ketol-acid reductoisomerase [Candidatus Diapherotrites archaeon]|uniref:Ketol-acid reductoisomerase (NADP(+)) n=1 Tax=Candidatus Iainarchaeum sp. TaxID=3101447 RepID=A0A7J4IYA9_9ARCH|nr:ketol-acid reductoisomerase [Candidatus Diapherotrites archaeon]
MKAESKQLKLMQDRDADLKDVAGKTVAVIGYGAQGAAQAMCMKDSGLDVIVGLRKGSESAKKALDYGFKVFEVDEAAKKADIIHLLMPDEVQSEVYERQIKQHLSKGKTLSFSHGFNICYGFIKPPADIDVIMVAPKAPGTEERKQFVAGFGVPALIAIKQDKSGRAKRTALAMAKACGFTRAGVLECTFEQETYEDLFGEQAVLCGGLSELIKTGFEVLVEAGYPPEMAYFECLHEMKLIVDLVYEGGMSHMWHVVSNTAEYGGRTRGKAIITPETKKRMKELLRDVESGKFATEWIAEYRGGLKNFKKLRGEQNAHEIEVVGKEIRALFKKK